MSPTVVIFCPGGLEHGGGIGRQMGYFLQARRPADIDVTYEVVDSRGPWFLGAAPFHVIFSGIYLLRALLRLLAARLRGGPCIVHVNITARGSTIRKTVLTSFARALRLRYLLHVHDYNYADSISKYGFLGRTLIAGMFRQADKILVLGGRERAALTRVLKLPSDSIAVMHNAVPDPMPEAVRSCRGDSTPRFLFLGHLSERKGVADLLRALASPELKERCWCATLAGGGPVEQYRRLAYDLGLADKTEFPGWVDRNQVKELFAQADILVLPSYAEGLAMSVLEGLSYGLAVITTPVGAHPEVIASGSSGLLVPPGDPAALAAALLRVLEDDALRDRLRAGARRCFLAKFDVNAYAGELRRVHHALLLRTGTLQANCKEEPSR